jgi:hypothetical protein
MQVVAYRKTGIVCNTGRDIRRVIQTHLNRAMTIFNVPRHLANDAATAVSFLTESEMRLKHVRTNKERNTMLGVFKCFRATSPGSSADVPLGATLAEASLLQQEFASAKSGASKGAAKAEHEANLCNFQMTMQIDLEDATAPVIMQLLNGHAPTCCIFRHEMCLHPDVEASLAKSAADGLTPHACTQQAKRIAAEVQTRHFEKMVKFLEMSTSMSVDNLIHASVEDKAPERQLSTPQRARSKGAALPKPARPIDAPAVAAYQLDANAVSPGYVPTLPAAAPRDSFRDGRRRVEKRNLTMSQCAAEVSLTDADVHATDSSSSNDSLSLTSSSDSDLSSDDNSDTDASVSGCSSFSNDSSDSTSGRRSNSSAHCQSPFHESGSLVAVGMDMQAPLITQLLQSAQLVVESDLADDELGRCESDDESIDGTFCESMKDLLLVERALQDQTDVLERWKQAFESEDDDDDDEPEVVEVGPPPAITVSTPHVGASIASGAETSLASLVNGKATRHNDLPYELWKLTEFAGVYSAYDFDVQHRVRSHLSTLKKHDRSGGTCSNDFLRFLAGSVRMHRATVQLRGRIGSEYIDIQMPEVSATTEQGPQSLHKYSPGQFKDVADRFDAFLDREADDKVVVHLVAMFQSPLQQYWVKHIKGVTDLVVIDDTFNASRLDASFGVFMGYAPVPGTHVPLACFVNMFEQKADIQQAHPADKRAGDGNKRESMLFLFKSFRGLGNPQPLQLQVDGDAATISAVPRDLIARVLIDMPKFLRSSDGVALSTCAASATAEQTALATRLLNALQLSDARDTAAALEALAADLNELTLPEFASAAGAAQLSVPSFLAAHLTSDPNLARIIPGICKLVLGMLVRVVKDVVEVARPDDGKESERHRLQYLTEFTNAIDLNSPTASASASRIRAYATNLMAGIKPSLRQRDLENVLQRCSEQLLPLLNPTHSTGQWLRGLLGVLLRLCVFHVYKSWNESFQGYFPNGASKHAWLADLRALGYAPTAAQFKLKLEDLQRKYNATKPLAVASFYRTWVDPVVSLYAGLWENYKRTNAHFLVNTTNAAETFFSLLKYILSGGHREANLQKTLVKLLGTITVEHPPDIAYCYLSSIEGKLTTQCSQYLNMRNGSKAVEARRDRSIDIVTVMIDCNSSLSADTTAAAFGLYWVRSHSSPTTVYHVNLSTSRCTCNRSTRTCKHIIACRMYHEKHLKLPAVYFDVEHHTAMPLSMFTYPPPGVVVPNGQTVRNFTPLSFVSPRVSAPLPMPHLPAANVDSSNILPSTATAAAMPEPSSPSMFEVTVRSLLDQCDKKRSLLHELLARTPGPDFSRCDNLVALHTTDSEAISALTELLASCPATASTTAVAVPLQVADRALNNHHAAIAKKRPSSIEARRAGQQQRRNAGASANRTVMRKAKKRAQSATLEQRTAAHGAGDSDYEFNASALQPTTSAAAAAVDNMNKRKRDHT